MSPPTKDSLENRVRPYFVELTRRVQKDTNNPGKDRLGKSVLMKVVNSSVLVGFDIYIILKYI